MPSRRILITGLSSDLGGRLAQILEQERGIEAVIGIDTEDPRHELHRTEFVRVHTDQVLLRRIIVAAAIDTVIDTRLITDPVLASLQTAREVNVAGTRSILAACAVADSPVRKLVFRSTAQYYGFEPDAPAFLTEDAIPTRAPQTAIQREVVEAEAAVREFAAASGATVSVLRFADPIGPGLRGSHLSLLSLPVIPAMLGFDPRWQLVHAEDMLGALVHTVRHDLPGTYNVAADGVLALSEIASLLGKPMLPVLPPWGTGFAAAQLRRVGLRIPLEMVHQLRTGRGLDNRRLKASGYAYRYTTREAVLRLRAHQRLRPLLGRGGESYRYEREVEDFLRWSPSVRSVRPGAADGDGGGPGAGPPVPSYDDLGEGELIDLISSLEGDALQRLRQYEAAHAARPRVLEALDRNLARLKSRS
jgi:UDP-glucose 4-epimerase